MDEQFVSVFEDGDKQIYRRVFYHGAIEDATWTVGADSERKEWEEVEPDKAEELERKFQQL